MREDTNIEEIETSIDIVDVSFADDEQFCGIDKDPDEILFSNSLRIMYQTNNIPLPQLVDMIMDKKVVDIEPEYLRRNRWSIKQQSRLIESLLLNVPIPSIYWFETDYAKYEVLDGQQRLTAIVEFFNGKFKLSGLSCLVQLNGKSYSDLPSKVRSTINWAKMNTIVLLLESEAINCSPEMGNDFSLKRFIFERLNKGGTRLNSQEIRNALYPGPLNDAIIELSRGKNFTTAFGLVPFTSEDPTECKNWEKRKKNFEYRTMKDCEIVLRFFALKNKDNIRGSFSSMLDRALISGPDELQIQKEKETFANCFDFLYELFDQKPFRLQESNGKKTKVSINLYDALMVAVFELWEKRNEILEDKSGVQQRLLKALDDKESYLTLTGKINGAKAILTKIEMAKSILYGKEAK